MHEHQRAPRRSTPPGEPTPPPAAADAAPPGAARRRRLRPRRDSASPPPLRRRRRAAAPALQGVPRRPASCSTVSSPGSSTAIILGVVYGIIAGIVGGVLITGYRSGGELFLYYLIISVISSVLYLGYYAYMESIARPDHRQEGHEAQGLRPRRRQQPDDGAGRQAQHLLAFGLAGIVPVVGTLLGGLASLGAVILIAVNINSDTVKRQHWFDKFAGGTQVMKIG